jgi:hypothetical protein
MPSKLLLMENELYLITKHNTTAKFADFRLYLINWQFFFNHAINCDEFNYWNYYMTERRVRDRETINLSQITFC